MYQASNLGRIKSLKRYKKNHSKLQLVEEKILSKYKNKTNGYEYVVLRKDGVEKNTRVHKLIAKTFIPNLYNKSQINHIDGDKANNKVDNLEWCTGSENIKHAYKNNLKANTNQKIKIKQFDKKHIFIQEFSSLNEASKILNLSIGNISQCINGKRKSCNGYIFEKE